MFILVAVPFADLRPMVKGGDGRVPSPDWTSDDPGAAFVRGFGKVSARNDKSLGLLGERFFADFNKAVRLRRILTIREKGWPNPLSADLRFRRLYFDGRMAGRFEFGFLVDDEEELKLKNDLGALAVDPRRVAADALASPIGVIDPGAGVEQPTTIQGCGRLLGEAYLAATTLQGDLNRFPPAEAYGSTVALGPPLVHVRLSNGVTAEVGRDHAAPDGSDGSLFFTSSVGGALRNNVLVRVSPTGSQAERGRERAVRVLFSHLHALMFAQGHFVKVQGSLDAGGRQPLKEAVDDLIGRLRGFTPTAPEHTSDGAFKDAMTTWGEAYSGRTDEVVQRLSELAGQLAKPTPIQTGLGWLNDLFQLVVKTGVTAAVEQATKAGG
ncbi:MAG TPA: hypothetical protein VGI95_03660 [Caulobacteraceae bacterium]|jgi:hypothetical protein